MDSVYLPCFRILVGMVFLCVLYDGFKVVGVGVWVYEVGWRGLIWFLSLYVVLS